MVIFCSLGTLVPSSASLKDGFPDLFTMASRFLPHPGNSQTLLLLPGVHLLVPLLLGWTSSQKLSFPLSPPSSRRIWGLVKYQCLQQCLVSGISYLTVRCRGEAAGLRCLKAPFPASTFSSSYWWVQVQSTRALALLSRKHRVWQGRSWQPLTQNKDCNAHFHHCCNNQHSDRNRVWADGAHCMVWKGLKWDHHEGKKLFTAHTRNWQIHNLLIEQLPF